jgi:hypothetical protein
MSSGTFGTLVVCDGRGWSLNGHWAHAIIIMGEGRIREEPGDSGDLSVHSCTP